MVAIKNWGLMPQIFVLLDVFYFIDDLRGNFDEGRKIHQSGKIRFIYDKSGDIESPLLNGHHKGDLYNVLKNCFTFSSLQICEEKLMDFCSLRLFDE